MENLTKEVKRRNYGGMPMQKLSHKKKDDEWRKSCLDYIIGYDGQSGYGTNRVRLKDMQMHYDLYNSIYDESDLKYVTEPFGQQDGFPASARDFNIIRPKVDALIGEELNKLFTYTVMRTSSAPATEEIEKAKASIVEYLMASIMAEVSPEEQAQFEQKLQTGEIQPPEQVLKFMKKDYRDAGEEAAYHMIKSLEKRLNLVHEFSKGWKDALISAEEIYHTYELNGNAMLRRVNPMYFSYEYNPNIEFIHESAWCVEHMRMSYSGVYDMLYDYMSEEDLDKLMHKIHGFGNDSNSSEIAPFGYNSINFSSIGQQYPNAGFGNIDKVDVWHCCWKSFRKIGFLTMVDEETGEVNQTVVDETYKLMPNESIEWRWVTEVWHGYRVGMDMYIGIEPMPHQKFSIDNPNSSRLPYTGVVHSNTNSLPRSLVSLLKPLQDMYIIVWYRLELAMSRDNGRVPVVDITQIPKSAELDIPRWMHMLKAMGVYFVNPYEHSADDPNRTSGRASVFNQYSALDLTMGQSIMQYAELLTRIENMVSMISGITPAREGITQERELVNNVQSNIVHSSNITAPWFWMHSQAKRIALQSLLELAKDLWSRSGKRYVDYVLDDGTKAILATSEDFFEDMDIFVTSDEKDLMKIQQLQNLFQPALQNGASLLDIAEILTLENTGMIKSKLKEIEENRTEQMNQAQQAQAQAMQAQQQHDDELKYAEMELTRYKVDADNQTRIAVAEIGAFRFQDNLDQNNNGLLDPIEVANHELARYEALSVENLEREKLSAEQRKADDDKKIREKELASKESIERTKAALEREKMTAAERLQKQKDQAAMEREQLKSRTALKNKVVGEVKTNK